MATVYSTEQTAKRALEAGTGYSLSSGLNATQGKVCVAVANYTPTAVVSGTVIELFTIPKNARILRGVLIYPNLGASSTLSIGSDVSLKYADDSGTETTAAGVANLLAATASSAAGLTLFAQTALLGAGGITSAATTFNAVTGGATLTAGAVPVTVILEYIQH